jgi:D-aspartate ligase
MRAWPRGKRAPARSWARTESRLLNDLAKNKGNPPAVLLGGGLIAVSAARELGSAGIPVYALGDAKSDTVGFSRYCAEFIDVGGEGFAGERFFSWLESGPRGAVIFPCRDDFLEIVARNRQTIEGSGYRMLEYKDDMILAMLDKERTYELARAVGVPAPRTVVVRSANDLDAAEEIGFPCALKPNYSHAFAEHFGGRQKVLLAESAQELREAWHAFESHDIDVILTEIIPGADDRFHSILTYMAEDQEPLFLITKQKFRQYPIQFGLGSYHATTWNPVVAELGTTFLRAIGLVGIANVEFKYDARDDKYKIIECNHRLTLTSELVRLAGVNSANLAYQRALGRTTGSRFGYRTGVRMLYPLYDFRAFTAYRAKGELSASAYAASLLHRQHVPLFRWSDPKPALMLYRLRAARARARLAAKVGQATKTHLSKV